ncbi:MAG TPA: alpha/beta fold hydrolase [Frankiaceae bacterium]|nr:alpha/beta fold hydrolase [Frankiaceae bacterium]
MYIIGATEQRRTVLLHGALASGPQLAGLADLLGGDCVLPDLPGHGASVSQAPYALDDFVDTARAALRGGGDLVGYSLGGTA